jgi:caffeoyl-CoA O-methyltransferase
MSVKKLWFLCIAVSVMSLVLPRFLSAQDDIDARVKAFLQRNAWRDMNVPTSDGQALYDIIVKNGYKKALEIGTSTGHSGIWIAWALSKTGGKLITIELDEARHKEALANFKEVGLDKYIDARLGNAHDITKELPGPFDFVFSDADKEWYVNYATTLLPKLTIGGCFTTHNVTPLIDNTGTNSGMRGGRGMGGRGGMGGMGGGGQSPEFVRFITSQTNLETTFITQGNGLAVSYKRAEK